MDQSVLGGRRRVDKSLEIWSPRKLRESPVFYDPTPFFPSLMLGWLSPTWGPSVCLLHRAAPCLWLTLACLVMPRPSWCSVLTGQRFLSSDSCPFCWPGPPGWPVMSPWMALMVGWILQKKRVFEDMVIKTIKIKHREKKAKKLIENQWVLGNFKCPTICVIGVPEKG